MPLSRRDFLKRMGAAVGGFGVAAAGYERLIPYIYQPDDVIPGVSTWYATSCRECPAGCGMVVRSRESRIVKCEGNARHPIGGGALCARGQAALHGLYDPDRIKGPISRRQGELQSVGWDDALLAVAGELNARRGRVALLTDLQTGSLDAMMRTWVSSFGSDRYLAYEPINYETVRRVYAGRIPSWNLAEADFLISFGADFLETWISPVEFARQFASMREVRDGSRPRFVYVGPRVSMTAANADVRIILPPGEEVEFARLLTSGDAAALDRFGRRHSLAESDLRRVQEGLALASSPMALPGLSEASADATIALGFVGPTISRPHALSNLASTAEVEQLVSQIDAGEIEALVVLNANPVYSLPEASGIVDALARVPLLISLSSFMDETTARAHWILPSNTPLESWGDYKPYSGVSNLMQPTMGTLFDTRHTGDILMDITTAAGEDAEALFGAENYLGYLKNRWGVSGQETQWESLLQVGGSWPGSRDTDTAVVPPTGYSSLQRFYSVPEQPAAAPPDIMAPITGPAVPTPFGTAPSGNNIKLWAYPHIYLYDGRGANRRWLQELPEPLVKGSWGSWIEMHPSTAEELQVRTEDMVEIAQGGVSVKAPAYVWGGIAPGVVAVPIGQGHRNYGRFAEGKGMNVLRLGGTDILTVRKAVGSQVIARWTGADTQQGRDIAQVTYLGDAGGHREVTLPLPEGYGLNDFYPGHQHHRSRWAMVVDMDRCIGCNACVAACYAENNIGVVGADGVKRRREMAWLRVDRYINWKRRSAPVLFQPMLCQHCDSAPCETVCPVFAAYHSEDGINGQIYNRCVGTRYCSNNCPYKVRRFNWFDYKFPEPMNYQLNPDVTVRSRGVMEKCTFCIQRVRQAGITARKEGRAVRDGEVVPACAQTCPTGVFTFGDLLDENSRVSQIIRNDPRAYQVLHELNTKSAVIYLRRIVERV